MSPLTAFLGKLLGLYCIILALAMFVNKQAMLLMVTGLLHNPSSLFITGVMALFAGLAMVLGHNVWSGGALPVIVTLIGWSTLIKALPFLFASPDANAGMFLGAIHYEQLFYWYAAFTLLLGAYLTYAGFRSTAHSGHR